MKIIFKNQSKLFADEVFAYFQVQNNILEKALAKGNVLIHTNSAKSSANVAVYNKNNNLITLKENVEIIKENTTISGDIGITNLKTGKSKIIGKGKNKRAKGKFLSKKK